MRASSIFAAGAVVALAAAVPMQPNRRDVVWVTDVQDVIVTVPVTETVWVTVTGGGEAEPTPTPSIGHSHHHHPSELTSHIRSTVTVQPSSPAETSAPETTSAAAPAATSTSTSEAAPTTSEAAPAPTTWPATSEAAPAPSTWTSTPVASAPTTSAQPSAPPPSSSAAASPTTSSGSGSGTSPSGAVVTGEITYYTPGLGSCGISSDATELVVAIPFGVMDNGANPNANPLCGQSITLSLGGVTVQAKVVDTCPTCADTHVDSSPAVFSQFAPLSQGVVSGIEWWFD